MYKNYLKVLPSKTGNGVFCDIEIPAKVPIIEITGDLFTEQNLPDHPAVLQIGTNLFLGPSGAADDYVNHSCDPNCSLQVLGRRAILYSLHVIRAGAELTFDYSTSSTDTLDKWKMDCLCGSIKCRKVISGLQYVDGALVDRYIEKGMIPLFMRNPIFQ